MGKRASFAKILTLFAVVLSLTIIQSPLPQTGVFPRLRPVNAAPTGPWTPAGPSSNLLQIVQTYAGLAAECAGLGAGGIDAMDGAYVPPCGAVCPAGTVLTGSNYCYNGAWQNVIDNGAGAPGTFNFFTPLNAYNPAAGADTFREGFQAQATGLNPYTAAVNAQNSYVLHNVYDQLYVPNPEAPAAGLLGWTGFSYATIPSTQLTYAPPAGTNYAIRNTLRVDINWQDGARLDGRDVAFTYLTLIKNLAPQNPPEMCNAPGCFVTGITLLNCILTVSSCNQFDLDVNTGAGNPVPTLSQLADIGSVTLLPGHIWSSCASQWSSLAFLPPGPIVLPVGSIGPSCGANNYLTVSAALLGADPITNDLFVGSGPWACQSLALATVPPEPALGTVGGGCSDTNTATGPAPTYFLLTRFGCTLVTPGATTSCRLPGSAGYYFRSVGNLALWFWSGNTGNPGSDFLNYSVAVSTCYGQAVGKTGCTRWQEGIGNQNGPNVIGIVQVNIIDRFIDLNWVNPFSWGANGIVPASPTMYERTSARLVPAFTLNPAADLAAGCALSPANGPPLGPGLTAYPNGGGYDC